MEDVQGFSIIQEYLIKKLKLEYIKTTSILGTLPSKVFLSSAVFEELNMIHSWQYPPLFQYLPTGEEFVIISQWYGLTPVVVKSETLTINVV